MRHEFIMFVEPRIEQVPHLDEFRIETRDLLSELNPNTPIYRHAAKILNQTGPEWQLELIDAILSRANRFSGARGEVSRQLLELLFERHSQGLPPIKQRELASILYPKTYRASESDPKVRKTVGRLRTILKQFFAEEGTDRFLRVEIPSGAYCLRFYVQLECDHSLPWMWDPYMKSRRQTALALFGDGRGPIYPHPTGWLDEEEEEATDQDFIAYCSMTASLMFHDLLDVEYDNRCNLRELIDQRRNIIVLSPPELDPRILDILAGVSLGIDIGITPIKLGRVLSTLAGLSRSSARQLYEDSEDCAHALVTRLTVKRRTGANGFVTLVTAWDPFAVVNASLLLGEEALLRPLRSMPGFGDSAPPEVFQFVVRSVKRMPDCPHWRYLPKNPQTVRIVRTWTPKRSPGRGT